jgi:hypothetical protein
MYTTRAKMIDEVENIVFANFVSILGLYALQFEIYFWLSISQLQQYIAALSINK